MTPSQRYSAIPSAWKLLAFEDGTGNWGVWTRQMQGGQLVPEPLREPSQEPIRVGFRSFALAPGLPRQLTFTEAISRIDTDAPWKVRPTEGDSGLSVHLPALPSGQWLLVELENVVAGSGAVEPWAQTVLGHFGQAYCEYAPHGPGVQILARVGEPIPAMCCRSVQLRRIGLYHGHWNSYPPVVRLSTPTAVDLSGHSLHRVPRALGDSTAGFEWLWRSYLSPSSRGTTTLLEAKNPPVPSTGQAPVVEWPPVPQGTGQAPTEPPPLLPLGRLLTKSTFARYWHLRGDPIGGECIEIGLARLMLKDGWSIPDIVAGLFFWLAEHHLDWREWTAEDIGALIDSAAQSSREEKSYA